MRLFHVLPPPHIVALLASSALAFAAGALLMSRRRVPVRIAAFGNRVASGANSLRERLSMWRTMRADDRGGTSGNSAFDAYRAATLKDLEAEANEFRAYLAGLRRTRDREAFDAFLKDRKAGDPISE